MSPKCSGPIQSCPYILLDFLYQQCVRLSLPNRLRGHSFFFPENLEYRNGRECRKCTFWKHNFFLVQFFWKTIPQKKLSRTQSVRKWEPDALLLSTTQHNQCLGWQLRNNWRFGWPRIFEIRATVTHLHSLRVSQLLLPSCSFPDVRPATHLFLVPKFHFWLISSLLDPRVNETKQRWVNKTKQHTLL